VIRATSVSYATAASRLAAGGRISAAIACGLGLLSPGAGVDMIEVRLSTRPGRRAAIVCAIIPPSPAVAEGVERDLHAVRRDDPRPRRGHHRAPMSVLICAHSGGEPVLVIQVHPLCQARHA
jgi:hypothetical protein